jgi:hypothetical protein
MAGLHAGCLLVAGLCLAGAAAAAITLPGRHFVGREAAAQDVGGARRPAGLTS